MEYPQLLIERYLTGRLRADEAAELRDWLKSDPAHIRDFTIETFLNRGIYEILMSERIAEECESPGTDDLLRVLAEKQRVVELAHSKKKGHQAFTEVPDDATLWRLLKGVEVPEERTRVIEGYAKRQLDAFLREEELKKRQQRSLEWRRSGLPFDLRRAAAKVETFARTTYKTVVVASALFLFALFLTTCIYYGTAHVRHLLSQRVVATLGNCQHARWAVSPPQPELQRGRLCLEEGWAQIEFLNGAQVILQAPCTFELRSSSSMFLENGTSTAKVTTPRSRGFTIDTPNSHLVDLGTEFGVLVDRQGGSEVHVFDGRVRLESARGSKHKKFLRELTEGWSIRINKTGAVRRAYMEERLFYRSLPEVLSFGIPGKRLDLADILGGGNGFGTGRMNCAINPLTGQFSATEQLEYVKEGKGHYARVNQNNFIDGVFIPNGAGGDAVVVSSQGHLFQGCPETSGWADGEIQNTHRTILYHRHKGGMTCRPRLGDRVFDTSAHPHIYMQGNVGITFDLGAIRSRLTGDRIRRFVTDCGVCAEIPIEDEQVDFWVFVDGQVRFSRRDATKASGAIKVDVPLYKKDRFLTLAITEGTDGSQWDLALFAEPALELGPQTKTNSSEEAADVYLRREKHIRPRDVDASYGPSNDGIG